MLELLATRLLLETTALELLELPSALELLLTLLLTTRLLLETKLLLETTALELLTTALDDDASQADGDNCKFGALGAVIAVHTLPVGGPLSVPAVVA